MGFRGLLLFSRGLGLGFRAWAITIVCTPSSGEGAGHSFGLHPLNSEGILYGTCSQGDGWSLPFPFSQENGGE